MHVLGVLGAKSKVVLVSYHIDLFLGACTLCCCVLYVKWPFCNFFEFSSVNWFVFVCKTVFTFGMQESTHTLILYSVSNILLPPQIPIA